MKEEKGLRAVDRVIGCTVCIVGECTIWYSYRTR
jgi:hypothetical protein